jgi:RsiW-degrading membrane proteinase PrsW (M82 family)
VNYPGSGYQGYQPQPSEGPGYQLAAPGPRDTRMRTVLLMTVLMSAVYGLQVMVDMLRPHIPGEAYQPLVGWLGPSSQGWWQKASFWSYVVSLPVALAVGLAGADLSRRLADPALRARMTRVWQGAAAAVLLLPYPYVGLDLITSHLPQALICVPSVVYALWLIHRMQRFRRLPVRLLLSMFAWGALVGVGFGYSIESWWTDYSPYFFAQGIAGGGQGAVAKLVHQVYVGNVLYAGVFEELGKGVGVAVVYLLLGRHIDNVVSGIVLGAACGAGFNLVESVMYMAAQNGQYASSQYFLRQSLGMMAAHVAFTAAIGAGFGIARQLHDPRSRQLAIVSGFATAMAGHFANDVFITFYGRVKQNWFSPSNTTDMLLFTPLTLAVLQGPLVAIYLVLLRRGLKDQAAALAVELRAEAATGFGVVTALEVPVLLRPARRFYLRLSVLQREGIAGYRQLGRLFAAQLDLGMARWHRSRGESEPSAPDEMVLRERIARLKHLRILAADTSSGQPLPVAP